MSKFLVLCDTRHYPSILVLGTREEAGVVYKCLKEGFVDWDGEPNPPEEYTTVEMIEVAETSLTSCDWSSISHSLICQDIEFL